MKRLRDVLEDQIDGIEVTVFTAVHGRVEINGIVREVGEDFVRIEAVVVTEEDEGGKKGEEKTEEVTEYIQISHIIGIEIA